MELTMFERLQELPLLQGLTTDDLNKIVTKVPLDFNQLSQNDEIAVQNNACKRLIFVLKGTVLVEHINQKNKICFREYLKAPMAIEPESLFGLNQTYKRTYTCDTPCDTLTIERSQFLSVMMDNPIVKTNVLNYICNKLQRITNKLENESHADAETKFRQLIQNYSVINSGKKQLITTMDSLAELLSETRLNVSKMLNALKEKGIITIERKSFTILDMSKL